MQSTIDTKQAEIDYPAKLDARERMWLATKPFGNFKIDESRRVFQDFSTILTLIQRHQPEASSILELGCGPGWLSLFLAQMGYQVTGYDLAPAMIEIAKQRGVELKITNSRFGVTDMEKELLDEHNRHDVVVIYDALHHSQNDQAVLAHAYRYLKPNGMLILAEPNRVHADDHDSLEAVERFGTTERGMSVTTLRKLLKTAGFRQSHRYHASGQSFEPRHEGFLETAKMLLYPFLVRFYFGGTRTRIWMVALKA